MSLSPKSETTKVLWILKTSCIHHEKKYHPFSFFPSLIPSRCCLLSNLKEPPSYSVISPNTYLLHCFSLVILCFIHLIICLPILPHPSIPQCLTRHRYSINKYWLSAWVEHEPGETKGWPRYLEDKKQALPCVEVESGGGLRGCVSKFASSAWSHYWLKLKKSMKQLIFAYYLQFTKNSNKHGFMCSSQHSVRYGKNNSYCCIANIYQLMIQLVGTSGWEQPGDHGSLGCAP